MSEEIKKALNGIIIDLLKKYSESKNKDIYIDACTNQVELYKIIEYLQTQILENKFFILKNGTSHWYFMDVIIQSFRDNKLLVAKLKNTDELVGYGVYDNEKIRIIEIFDKYKRKGYGRFLLEYMENKISSILITAFPITSDSIEFWKKCKYETCIVGGILMVLKNISRTII